MASSPTPGRARRSTSLLNKSLDDNSHGGRVLKIGHYILGETLGSGTFGKVKLAEHQLLSGHKVAVKIINRNKIQSLQVDEKIRREIQLLKLFRHPHIIKLFEVIETPTAIFMIMEYVPGGELFELIVKSGKLSEREARRFFQQIICGVEYLHQHMVVHRDLKPENLLLDGHKNVKIADFGLSNFLRDGEFLKTSCGSPNYAAPEVISGEMYAGPEIDVWSCGVILYALLCGALPFEDEYVPALFKKIKQGDFKIPSFISPSCKELLCAMLTQDPLQRITIKEIRDHSWFQTDLPAYLQTPSSAAIHIEVDDALVGQVAEIFHMPKEQVELILRTPVDKLGLDEEQIVVAYNIMYEQKAKTTTPAPTTRKPETGSSLSSRSMSNAVESGPRSLTSISTPVSLTRSLQKPQTLLSTTPTMSLREGKSLAEVIEEENAAKPQPQEPNSSIEFVSSSRTWTLGIVSKLPPKEIMGEVLSALKTLDFEWKFITAYRFRCRKIMDVNGQPKQVKMSIQLYQLSRDMYLLDFQKLDGEIFLFFEISAQLLGIYSKVFHIPSISSSVPRKSGFSFFRFFS